MLSIINSIVHAFCYGQRCEYLSRISFDNHPYCRHAVFASIHPRYSSPMRFRFQNDQTMFYKYDLICNTMNNLYFKIRIYDMLNKDKICKLLRIYSNIRNSEKVLYKEIGQLCERFRDMLCDMYTDEH